MPRRDSSETSRQILHILVGLAALLLRWLTWWQAALTAAAAVVFNVLVLPRLASRVFRSGDLDRPAQSGIVIYPAAVLGLILIFPARLDIAATAWAILAAGDGFATIVGTHVRTRRLSWNREKSVGGLLAFVVFGSLAGILTACWMMGASPASAPVFAAIIAPTIAAGAAGLVETAPIRLNDNISVPGTAAIALWSLTFVDAELAREALVPLGASVPIAVGFNAAVAAAGYFAGAVTLAGAAVGGAIGVAVMIGAGLSGWILLFAAFLFAAVTTRLGFARKAAAGIAESRGGRRGPGNALANTGLAAWAAAVSIGMRDPSLAHLAMVAALVTASSDTVASEAGKAWGRTTWLPFSLRRVPPGTTGAVSLEGTMAGLVSALLLAWLAERLGLISSEWILCVVVASTVASLAEGVLGTAFESSGVLNNDALNFINSAIGAGLAIGWMALT
jgi:uncharacterized protein (TIGR00297 family)